MENALPNANHLKNAMQQMSFVTWMDFALQPAIRGYAKKVMSAKEECAFVFPANVHGMTIVNPDSSAISKIINVFKDVPQEAVKPVKSVMTKDSVSKVNAQKSTEPAPIQTKFVMFRI